MGRVLTPTNVISVMLEDEVKWEKVNNAIITIIKQKERDDRNEETRND